jgi:phosphoglucosamine mutase
MGKLFGTDGIRGEANRYPMDGATAFSVGQAITQFLKKKDKKTRIVIGRDTRITGQMLQRSLESGIMSMGGEPCPVGILPTPGIAYMARVVNADAGIVISASHNPYEDNGIKLFSGSGFKMTDSEEASIEDLILEGRLPEEAPFSNEVGEILEIDKVIDDYITFIEKTLPEPISIKGMKIVLDTANGATSVAAPILFSRLGADVEVIHNHPDGININRNCGSQYTRDLQKRVIETGAQLGIAFDGDGDRLIAVDEKGKEITGDQILLICAEALKEQGKLKNNLIVSSVMSNIGLTMACKKLGIERHASRVGDRQILQDMLRLGAVAGGEESGHIILLDHHTTSDGMITALQLMAAMIKKEAPLSDLASTMDVYPQKLINVPVSQKPDLSTLPLLQKTIMDVEKELGSEGRVLVRYSGTQNVCRVMVEGPSSEITGKQCRLIAEQVAATLG